MSKNKNTSKPTAKKRIPKPQPKVLSFAEFPIYDAESIVGGFGQIKYFGKCKQLANKPQFWSVEVEIYLASRIYVREPDKLAFKIKPPTKIMVGSLADLINDEMQKDINEHIAEVRPNDDLYLQRGLVTCTIL